jgi:hypothetical protein
MKVKVERCEPDKSRMLVFATNERGEKVALHLSGKAALKVKQALDAGLPVELEVPS